MFNAKKFFLPGKPVPKERPRIGRNGNVYTPTKTAEYEKLVKIMARVAGVRPEIGPVKVAIEVAFRGANVRRSYPMSRNGGDLDNILKSILDGLNQIGYNDDAQIVSLGASKRWCNAGEQEGVTVWIGPVETAFGGEDDGKLRSQALSEVQEPGVPVQLRKGRSPEAGTQDAALCKTLYSGRSAPTDSDS